MTTVTTKTTFNFRPVKAGHARYDALVADAAAAGVTLLKHSNGGLVRPDETVDLVSPALESWLGDAAGKSFLEALLVKQAEDAARKVYIDKWLPYQPMSLAEIIEALTPAERVVALSKEAIKAVVAALQAVCVASNVPASMTSAVCALVQGQCSAKTLLPWKDKIESVQTVLVRLETAYFPALPEELQADAGKLLAACNANYLAFVESLLADTDDDLDLSAF